MYQRYLYLTACCVVLASLSLFGADCQTLGDPAAVPLPGEPDELSAGEFILYSHPDDPRVFGGLTDDGEGLTVYAEKDADGFPTRLTSLRYQTPEQLGTDDATWLFFDENGDIEKMLGEDGGTIEYEWQSDTRVTVNVVSADGEVQINTTIDLDESGGGKPKWSAAERPVGQDAPSRIGLPIGVEVFQGPVSGDETVGESPWIDDAKVLAAAAPSNRVVVFVERCGHPVNGADVFVTWGSQYDAALPVVRAESTGISGEYSARIPVGPSIIDATPGEICQSIAGKLGDGCNFLNVQGAAELLCLEIGAAVEVSVPTLGEGVGVGALCELGFLGLRAYCATLGASGGGAPSVADFICKKIKQVEDSGYIAPEDRMQLQASASLPGVDRVWSSAVIVNATGPYPELNVDFGGDLPGVDRFTTEPSDPDPGEGYTATVRLSCIPAGSTIRLSISGSDEYSNSTSITADVNNPNPIISLYVPGASKGTVDTLTVEVSGTGLKRNIYAVF